MEIKIVSRQGVPAAEVEAHRRIQEEFHGTLFSRNWRGYAAFGLQRQGRSGGASDYDLVLVTHTNVIVVELKNWNGRLLRSDGQKWYFDGEDRGTSPVIVANDKSRKLASALKSRLGDAKVPFVGFLVVLHGNIEKIDLPQDEARSVMTLTEFLSLRFESEYRLRFWRKGANPLDFVKEYDAFFLGSATRPREYLIQGFRPDPNPIFEHPQGLYSEFRGVAKDDPQARALIRKWDFTKAGAQFAGEADRAAVALRERRVYTYVSDRSEELALSLLRPLSHTSEVTTDYCEVFSLPSRVARLAEFANASLPKLSTADRLALSKVLLSKCADLHDLLIAHRDLSDHSVWLDIPPRALLSGLSVAYYPKMKTVGASRDRVKVDPLVDSSPEPSATEPTPYQRDAFMLGVVAHLLLYGERPAAVKGRYFWQKREEDPFQGALDAWFVKALAPEPGHRFASARPMLDALNEVTATESEFKIEARDIEAFRAETKERDYPDTRTIADDEKFLCFESLKEGQRLVVKVWYGVEADMQEPAGALAGLAFLEKARAFESSGLVGIPRIVDYGLSRGALLLVQEWVEGSAINEWLAGKPDQDQRVAMAQSLLDTLERLHDLELVHGDVHPGNIVCCGKQVVLIDGLDYRRAGGDAYTTAYLPAHYKSMSLADRDRYGALAVVAEILGAARSELPRGIYPIPEVYAALAESLSSEGAVSAAPVRSALKKLVAGDAAATFEGAVTLRNLGYGGFSPGPLPSDNGKFHVAVNPSKSVPGCHFLRVTGVGFELRIDWDGTKHQLARASIVRLPQSQFLRNQNQADAHVSMRLTALQGSANDADDLARFLMSVPEIQARAGFAGRRSEGDEDGGKYRELPSQGKIAAIWSALLEAEEDSFPLVVVAEEPKPTSVKDAQVHVLCHLDSGVLDFEPQERVVVENQDQNGDWRHYGLLDFRESTVAEIVVLAVDNPSPRANVRIGSKLRLVAAGNKGSLTKRKAAVERILADRANVTNLAGYFDPATAATMVPIEFSGPSRQDLEAYATGVFRLNANQQQAFTRVLTSGPISLLQGPPGTGKTTFIAALLHYLVTRDRARRILLVSQSHEAVNNVLEKASDAFQQTQTTLDAVRLGAQNVVSNAIRGLSADSVEQYYRESFKAEQKKRLIGLGIELGLPIAFCGEFITLQLQLGSIADRIGRWRRDLSPGQNAESTDGGKLQRLTALEETFFQIAATVYGHEGLGAPEEVLHSIEASLVRKHGVLSRSATERLRTLVNVSNEWVSVLGAPEGNFVEFLAHARSVVAGTCVGIAQRGAFVTQNIYDWVIIDEAGRAAPSELAVAMQTGRRVLLVGDHKQLPPTFPEEVKNAMLDRFQGIDSEMFNSDFARIFDSEYGRRVGTTLTSQYRMAGTIGRLVSECFYDGLLETARASPPDYYDLLPEELSKEVTWVDMSPLRERGYEQRTPAGDAIANEQEARVVLGILKRILESEDFVAFLADHMETAEKGHDVPIGIICFYAKQRDLIDRGLAEATWLGERRRWVKVDTVDAYQGKENRIIILSTVRNNPQGTAGFLRMPNRVNVAMSRAMERLFVVGSRSMWGGRNAQLPLGKVLAKVEEYRREGCAAVESAEGFLQ